MKIVPLSGAPRVPFDLEGYIMHSSHALEIIHLVLLPGQEIVQHSNPFNLIICLIKGEIALNTGPATNKLSLYDTTELEKNTDRGFINTGKTEARLMILKQL
jgi:quercetin dioxygenase-like cupin family protein